MTFLSPGPAWLAGPSGSLSAHGLHHSPSPGARAWPGFRSEGGTGKAPFIHQRGAQWWASGSREASSGSAKPRAASLSAPSPPCLVLVNLRAGALSGNRSWQCAEASFPGELLGWEQWLAGVGVGWEGWGGGGRLGLPEMGRAAPELGDFWGELKAVGEWIPVVEEPVTEKRDSHQTTPLYPWAHTAVRLPPPPAARGVCVPELWPAECGCSDG